MKLTFVVKQAPLGSHQMIGQRFSFDESGGSFGRAAGNDLVIPDPNRYVSSRHGLVTFDNGVFSVYDQSSNGLFADGANTPIGSGHPYALHHGSTLRAGEYSFEVFIDESGPEAAGAIPEAGMPGQAGEVPPAAGELQGEKPVLRAVPSPSQEPEQAVEEPPAGLPLDDDQIEKLSLDLALRLGLHGMSEDKLHRMPEFVTDVVRSCVAGVMDVLSSRRQVKHQLHVDTTVIQNSHNNALKFSASADEAIERMFSRSGEGYLPPDEALMEAFQDIADHQVAMMAATIQVYQTLAERFDPERLEETLAEHKKDGMFSGKPRLWEEYRRRYQEIAQDGHASIHEDFVKEFSEAYSTQLIKLKRERGKVAP